MLNVLQKEVCDRAVRLGGVVERDALGAQLHLWLEVIVKNIKPVPHLLLVFVSVWAPKQNDCVF